METTLLNAEILFIGAHPDDVELGCAGTIAKLTAAGHKVGIIDLTAGEMGSRGSAEVRLHEAAAAAKILGVAFRHCLFMPDTQLKLTDESEKKMVEIIRAVRPRVVFTPYPRDTHPDHIATTAMFDSAWYKAGFAKYDHPLPRFRPERIFQYYLGLADKPSFIVDISTHIAKRRSAILSYASQFGNTNDKDKEPVTRLSSPDFLDSLETRLRYFGQRIMKDFGEPFFMQQLPEIDNPATLTDSGWIFRANQK